MKHMEAVFASRRQKLVPDDKFDRHMKRARVQDICSRKKIFDEQTENGLQRSETRKNIQSSTY
jgi:hypothetical protein